MAVGWKPKRRHYTPQQLADLGASGASPSGAAGSGWTPRQLADLGASGASPNAYEDGGYTPKQLADLGASGASPDEAMGGGQDSADQRWDMYEARDKQGAMGAGGQGGMGAGGVYVQAKDGSMHWDETAPDPNPSGGSVVQAGTEHNVGGGTVIPGANRQSGPTGPGGTGPPGSQARGLHVAELTANPSFISPGGSIFPGANAPGWKPGMMLGNTAGAAMDAAMAYGGPGGAAANPATAQTSQNAGSILSAAGFVPPRVGGTPHSVAGELDPFSFKTYGNNPNWPGRTNFGGGQDVGAGAEGGMGAGQPPTTQTPAMDPGVLGNLINNAAQIQVQNNQEEDNYRTNLLTLAQNWQIHQDDLQYQQAVEAEVARHNQATETLTASQQQIDVQLAQLDAATRKQVQDSINQTAIQQAQMGEASQIYQQQGQQAFQDWQTRQQNAMSILGSALSNPWLQQLSGMAPPGGAGSPVGGANIQALVQQLMTPYDTSQYGVSNAPAAANIPGGAQGTPQQQRTNLTAPGGGGFAGGAAQPQSGTPDWNTWQSWSPWQKAAYRANVEAAGPGAWNAQQQNLQSQFAGQGGSPDITQMASAAANPAEQVGQQMTAGAFGETPQQWQTQQTRQWSQAAAPSVKQNLGVSQGGASSSGATPEQQFGI